MEAVMERHPKWKALVDRLTPLLEEDRVFTYAELKELLGGLDPQGTKGRQHVLRAIREIRCLLDFHLENVYRQGYRVVRPREHAACATSRVRLAKRRMQTAKDIMVHTQVAKLDQAELQLHEHIGRRIVFQLDTLTREVREMRRELAHSRERLPHPLLDAPKESKTH